MKISESIRNKEIHVALFSHFNSLLASPIAQGPGVYPCAFWTSSLLFSGEGLRVQCCQYLAILRPSWLHAEKLRSHIVWKGTRVGHIQARALSTVLSSAFQTIVMEMDRKIGIKKGR